MNDHDRLQVNNFLSSIADWGSAYAAATFSYIAIKRNGFSHLLYGRIFLTSKLSEKALPSNFETKNILANSFLISDLGINYQEFITQIVDTKQVKLPKGELLFPATANGSLDAYFNEFHMDSINSENRLSFLRLDGEKRYSFLRQPEIDWELKGANPPFDSILDLMSEYSLIGCDASDSVNIEIISNNVVEIDSNSKIVNDVAELSVFLENSLDQKKCTIGYRVLFNEKIHSRGSLSANEIFWKKGKETQHGIGTLKIPVGASVHCVATYAGVAQHQCLVVDLKNFSNSRRVLLEECDTDLSVLRDYLFNEKKPRKESRDFEIGVAQLMWMLGYSALQPGASPRTSDAVDVIATTAKGNILLIECTTGLLKVENKLAQLHKRANAIKQKMQIGHNHLIIYPMIVTAMTRQEVSSEIKGAHELGIIVVTKDELLQMLDQTITVTDSDTHFDQLIRSIPLQQKYNY